MHPKLLIVNLPVTEEFRTEKRLIQDRGELHLIEDGNVFRHLGCFTLAPGPGRWRGGHVHARKTEIFYVMRGLIEIDCVDVESGERFLATLRPGDKARMSPELAHRFRALPEGGEAIVVEYYENRYEKDDDMPYDFTGETSRHA